MKKALSVFLTVLLLIGCCTAAAGAKSNETSLRFNEDGTFKIMQINDTQDVGKNMDKRLPEFLAAALDIEKPDLVVMVGDQLSDVYPFASAADYKLAIDKTIAPIEERGIPFLATLGNHDHDRADVLNEAGMYELYAAHGNFISTENGPDPFTYSVPVLSSDGSKTVFNIYMMDSNNKGEGAVSYSGIFPNQLEWYNKQSAKLKAENGGQPMPSLLFQHVPVKEIYELLKESTYSKSGSIFARRNNKWYELDEENAAGWLKEAPCSENFDTITGQYEAWLANGDIMGAFFAHDHVNNFEGVTPEGIRMGYNGGTGFRSYGAGGDRTVRIFELNENNVTNYTTHTLTYNQATGKNVKFVASDLFTPALLNYVMRGVYFLFGWVINLVTK